MNLFRVLDKTVGIGFMVVAEDWADVPGLIDALEMQWREEEAITTLCACDVMEEPQVLTAFRIKGADQKPPIPGSNSGRRNPEYKRRRRATKRANKRAKEAADA